MPEFLKVNSGIGYIELILRYTLTRIEESDKRELGKILKSHLNPEIGEKLMTSLAHPWEKQGIEKGIHIGEMKLTAKLKEEKIVIAKNLLKAGLIIDLIANSTGLKKEEIKKLK